MLTPGNSNTSYTPVSTKLWKMWNSCSVEPKCSQPRTANRALLTVKWGKAHRIGQRTLRFPKSTKAPALPHWDQFSPQALLHVALLPNPAGLSVHSDQGPSRSYAPEGQSTQKVPPLTKVKLVMYTWQKPQGIRKATNRSNTPSI